MQTESLRRLVGIPSTRVSVDLSLMSGGTVSTFADATVLMCRGSNYRVGLSRYL